MHASADARLAASLEPRLTELRRLQQKVAAFARRHRIPPRALSRLKLVIEEVFVNVVKHGYAAGGTRRIGVELHAGKSELMLFVTDGGTPFDPTTFHPPEPVVDLASASVRGRGLLILRALADSLHYQRRPGRNELTVRLLVEEEHEENAHRHAGERSARENCGGTGRARDDSRRASGGARDASEDTARPRRSSGVRAPGVAQGIEDC